MHYWKKHTRKEIKTRVFDALSRNINFYQSESLGVPASHLDKNVFYQDATFLKDAPFLSTLINNPNHIGCHTLGHSESFFSGTQQIERELIHICATDILNASVDSCDGYVASGGTEANMQAIWVYRNYFKQEFQATPPQIGILCSKDSHYSMAKASDVLGIRSFSVPVDLETRTIQAAGIAETLESMRQAGIKHVIAVANMMTTMFGSVDPIDLYTDALLEGQWNFKLHVDGAYGGFYFPFANPGNQLDFSNPHVTSVTLDAHKMVQAPYGTGIFVVRKGYMKYTNTREASYVAGEDFTLIGSRSGANAVAVWMILVTYGPYGWREKVLVLQNRADAFTEMLKKANIPYFRALRSNIVTIKASHVPTDLAEKFGLVPDNHQHPTWYKVVIMDHATMEHLTPLAHALVKFSKAVH
jgi:tyrosine decarboxylase/aspartate 1-decarboxylase